jgi:adenylate cyclase
MISLKNQSNLMLEQMNQFGESITRLFAESAREPLLANDRITLETLARKIGNTPSTLGAAIYSEQGETISRHGIVPELGVIELYRRSQILSEFEYSIVWSHLYSSGASEDMISYLTPIRYKDLVTGHVLVTFSRRHIEEQFFSSIQKLTAIIIIMLLLAISLAVFLSRRITQPINELVNASIAIAEGDYSYRLHDKRHDEVGQLMQAFNDMAHGLLKKSQVENALSRYVSSNVAKQILNNLEQIELGGTHVRATVLFADIVGFTSLSETLTPHEVSEILNEYFTMVAKASNVYSGTVDKFIGDCAMLVFGVPEKDPQQHFHAVACAVLIQKATALLNQQRARRGKPEIHFRIGINTGNMLAGNMGSHDRMQYTVVGDAVNLASRLSNIAGADEILVQEDLFNQVDLHTRVIAHKQGEITVRGKAEPVSTYVIEDLAMEYHKPLQQQARALLEEQGVA